MSHIHDDSMIKDDDKFFIVDPETRDITNETGDTLKIIQFDHNSERCTFELPRYIDGHDMMESNKVEIHYINTSSGTSSSTRRSIAGIYDVTDLQVNPDNEETVTCTWLISMNSTQLAGTLKFILKFICYDQTGEDTASYIWHSNVCKLIEILPGMNNGDDIMTTYPDMFLQLNQEFDEKLEALKDITKGEDGITPHVGDNGNWFIGDTDTGISASGSYTLPAAGESLGGVKSGGDVSINDGVIAVNDDSHDHTRIKGVRPSDSGLKPPSYVGANTTRFNMLDGFIGTEMESIGPVDVILMNNNSLDESLYITALAIQKIHGIPKAWIAAGQNGDSWGGATELITANNISDQTVKHASTAGTSETWTFTLADGETVEKVVFLG